VGLRSAAAIRAPPVAAAIKKHRLASGEPVLNEIASPPRRWCRRLPPQAPRRRSIGHSGKSALPVFDAGHILYERQL